MAKNIELLKRLRTRFLRMRHPQHLDMRVIAKDTECGAAMCLIGHTLDLSGCKMRKRGLAHPDYFATLDFDFIRPDGKAVNDPGKEAAKLWGMKHGDAMRIFQDFSIKTPKQAAARIERLIEEG